MYSLGAAYALQQAPNFKKCAERQGFRVFGASSGTFGAIAIALSLDCSKFMHLCLEQFGKHRRRIGGCIGMYSHAVRGIVTSAIEGAGESVASLLGRLAGGRLEISVTRFSPWPERVRRQDFGSKEELVDVLMASCHIPVAYETPVVLGGGLGFCIDGCMLDFLPEAACVISPFHCHSAEIAPAEEHPGSMNFALLHEKDILRLFEDGYLDAVRWLESGARSRRKEREGRGTGQSASLMLLVCQGVRTARSLLGFPCERLRASKAA